MRLNPIAEYTYGDFAVTASQPALRDRQIKTSLSRIYPTVLCVLFFRFVESPPAFSEDTFLRTSPKEDVDYFACGRPIGFHGSPRC